MKILLKNFLLITLISNVKTILINPNDIAEINILKKSFIPEDKIIKILNKIKKIKIEYELISLNSDIYFKEIEGLYELAYTIKDWEFLESSDESIKILNKIVDEKELFLMKKFQFIEELKDKKIEWKKNLKRYTRLIKNYIENILLKNNKLSIEEQKMDSSNLFESIFYQRMIILTEIENFEMLLRSKLKKHRYTSIPECFEKIQKKDNYFYYFLMNELIEKEEKEFITFLTDNKILSLRVTNSNSFLVLSPNEYFNKKTYKIYLSLPRYYNNLTLMTLTLEHSMNFQKIIRMFQKMILINEYFNIQNNNRKIIKMFKIYLVNNCLIKNYNSLHKNDKNNLINQFYSYSETIKLDKNTKNNLPIITKNRLSLKYNQKT